MSPHECKIARVYVTEGKNNKCKELRDLWGTINYTNIYIILGVPERRGGRQKGEKNILKDNGQ